MLSSTCEQATHPHRPPDRTKALKNKVKHALGGGELQVLAETFMVVMSQYVQLQHGVHTRHSIILRGTIVNRTNYCY